MKCLRRSNPYLFTFLLVSQSFPGFPGTSRGKKCAYFSCCSFFTFFLSRWVTLQKKREETMCNVFSRVSPPPFSSSAVTTTTMMLLLSMIKKAPFCLSYSGSSATRWKPIKSGTTGPFSSLLFSQVRLFFPPSSLSDHLLREGEEEPICNLVSLTLTFFHFFFFFFFSNSRILCCF